MKILVVINDIGSYYNFLQELVLQLCQDENYEVHIVSSSENVINIAKCDSTIPFNLRFHTVDIPRSFAFFEIFRASFKISKIIEVLKPDIVHAHFLSASLVTLLLKKSGIKYLTTLHGLGLNSTSGFKKLLFSLSEYFIFLRTDYIFLINDEDFKYVSNIFPEKALKLNSYGVGCDIKKFSPKPLHVYNDSRKKLGIEHDAFVISYTGRFVSFKGFHIVVKTFIELQKKSNHNIFLILIGGKDNLHFDGLNSEEWRFIDNSKNVLNVGFSNAVEDYLALSNLFFFPSVKEGLPVSVMEALSVGLPVLGFKTRGMEDLIVNGQNGILITKSNDLDAVNTFSSIISDLFSNGKELMSLSHNALKSRNSYSRNNFISKSIVFYNTLKT